MATLAVCKKCHNVYKYDPKTVVEGGIVYTTVLCPNCGHLIKESRNHIHYGEDRLN